jgi:hypothetical protein
MIAGKDSKQPIIHFWACGYLVPFATLGGFPGLHEEWIVHVQGTFTTGTSITIGNAAPLLLQYLPTWIHMKLTQSLLHDHQSSLSLIF